MLGSSRRKPVTCVLRVLLVLAALGLASRTTATPVDPAAGESPAAGLSLDASPGIEADWVSVSAIGADAEPDRTILEPPRPDAEAAPDARPPDPSAADAPRNPEADAARLRDQLDLAGRQAKRGDLEGAAASLERAIGIDPDRQEARAQLGVTLVQLGRTDEAEGHLLRAIELGGESALVHAALAEVAKAQGRPGDAIEHGREALRLDPGLVPAANNLAWLLATWPDPEFREPEEAIRLARGALRAVPGEHPQLLDTLAAAYAAAGRYDEAVRTATRAEALALERGLPEIAREIREHLDRYRAGQPFVQS